jgi:hypothetical protein
MKSERRGRGVVEERVHGMPEIHGSTEKSPQKQQYRDRLYIKKPLYIHSMNQNRTRTKVGQIETTVS